MAAIYDASEDPYLELLDVEANDLDDKELEELMTPEEKMKQKIEEEARKKKTKKVDSANPPGDETSEQKPDEEDDSETADKNGGQYVTLFEKRLTNATEWKNRGNDAFREKNYKTALKHYHGALIFLRGIENDVLAGDAWASGRSDQTPHDLKKEMERGSHPTPENLRDWKNLRIDAYNNIITCMLKEKECIAVESVEEESRRFDKMLKLCDEILELHPENAKALFKKGKINFLLEKYDEAYELFRKAERHVAGKPDGQLTEYIARCESLISAHYRDMMGMFSGVFDKMASEEERERERERGRDVTRAYGDAGGATLTQSSAAPATDPRLESLRDRLGLSETNPRHRDVAYNILIDDH